MCTRYYSREMRRTGERERLVLILSFLPCLSSILPPPASLPFFSFFLYCSVETAIQHGGYEPQKQELRYGRIKKMVERRQGITRTNFNNAEYRLLKYSRRGFAVAVPGLDKSRIDPDLLTVCITVFLSILFFLFVINLLLADYQIEALLFRIGQTAILGV